MRLKGALLGGLLLAAPAMAEPRFETFPPLAAELQTVLTRHYPGTLPHAALAFVQDTAGQVAWGMASGATDAEAAAREALGDCTAAAAAKGIAKPCRLAARNATPGAATPEPVPPPQRVGPFRLAPLLRHWGPAQARGAVIWSHGSAGPRGTDLSATPTPG